MDFVIHEYFVSTFMYFGIFCVVLYFRSKARKLSNMYIRDMSNTKTALASPVCEMLYWKNNRTCKIGLIKQSSLNYD